MFRQNQSNQDQIEIKEELSKFINLLQNDFKPHEQRRQQYSLSKKLSVILSASQPQSSSLDKQNSNPSANRSFESNEKPIDDTYEGLFQALSISGLSSSQLKLVDRLRQHFEQMRTEADRAHQRSEGLTRQLAGQKTANDEMLVVLMKLDKQQKQLWSNYNVIAAKYQQALDKSKEAQADASHMNQSLIAMQNDNQFMKKLIFHANQNYEALEKKCQHLEQLIERSQANTDRKNVKRSSIDNLLKSAKTKKNGQSPAHSEVQQSPSFDDFQQIYRKMILRTLKFKGRQHQIR